MQLQARIGRETEHGSSDLRQWYHSLRAAAVCLEELFCDLQHVREFLNADKRYRSSSCHPLFANRASFLLADTITNTLNIGHHDNHWRWDSYLFVRLWAQVPPSFWITLAAYHLGHPTFIKHRLMTFHNVEMCKKLAARQGHANVLQDIVNKSLNPRVASEQLAQVLREACLAGQVDCAKVVMSHISARKSQGSTHMTILHLNSERRQIGQGCRSWKLLRDWCGKLLPHDNTDIPDAARSWAEELIRILVIQEGWVPLSASRAIGERISTLFWKTVESSFLLLHQHEDGTFSTATCREMLEKYDTKTSIYLYNYIEQHFSMWLTPQLRLRSNSGFAKRHRRHVFAAGTRDGLEILASCRIKLPDACQEWFFGGHECVTTQDFHFLGQLALWYAITKLRPENVEILLKLGMRLPESMSMELVSWEYRRTREKEYQAIQELLQVYHVRPIETGLGQFRRPEDLGRYR